MLDTALALAYAHYAEISLQGWHLAFVLACTAVHALALLCMLLFSAFFLVFVAREVTLVCAQLLRHCARVGGMLLGVAHHARVNDSVYAWTKVLSSGELSSMQSLKRRDPDRLSQQGKQRLSLSSSTLCPDARDDMLAARSECAKRALLCLLNLVIVLESCVAVLVFDQSAHLRSGSSSSTSKQQPSALMSLWLGMQYASFGASVVFAGAVWLAQRSRAVVLLANALFFALYGLQWLALALCTLLAGYSTSAALFAVLSLHPLVGFVLSRASGRQARDEVERQEALEIVFAHEESLYHRAEA